jgi:hypothetical protein
LRLRPECIAHAGVRVVVWTSHVGAILLITRASGLILIKKSGFSEVGKNDDDSKLSAGVNLVSIDSNLDKSYGHHTVASLRQENLIKLKIQIIPSYSKRFHIMQ